ncbi:hypothetical protein EDM21_17505 [Paenibacillus sp. N10]|uniref:Putative amidase domain-containing protein n=2 Tax=Paenibacillus lutrae TaxID=2078573 RepID=A0A7X3FKB4_9BACL|nr:hypothetical protein [Paenibacillus lutrae]
MVCLLALMTVSSASVQAKETTAVVEQTAAKDIRDYVENFVTKAYEPYYKFNSIQSTVSDYVVKDNVLTANVNLSLSKTLKAQSVDELPYVKGLQSQLNTLQASKSVSATDLQASNQVLREKKSELQEYIGTATEQNDTFRVTAKLVNGSVDLASANLEFLNYIDYVPASNFIPESEAAMVQNGQEGLLEAVAESKASAAKTSAVAPAAIKYNRIAARDYANKWTSEVAGGGYDTSKWNPKYAKHTENGGVDCANYVSQAIFAGGIPTDTKWKPESTAWINTGYSSSIFGLKDYMVDKGYFYKTTKANAPAGGFISYPTYSHVVFIVANDTVTMQFSAHTNDRLKSSFAGFSSAYEFYYISAAYR